MTRKKKIVIALFCVLAGLLGLAVAGFYISKARTFQFFGRLTARVTTDQKVVALTFDDAPTRHTREVLNVLQQKNIPATFYAIGKNLEEYPTEARAIVEQGSELGNHSYSHSRMFFTSGASLDEEVGYTNELIRQAGYEGEITFRPPYGKKLFSLPWYLAKHNIATIMWDVEPDTYVPGNSDAIVAYTINHTSSGSIILLHPLCDQDCEADRQALPKIIDALTAQGYKFVTVSKLLQYGLSAHAAGAVDF